MFWLKRQEAERKSRIVCLVCGYSTLSARGRFEICPVCFWEDEGEIEDIKMSTGGPNGDLSLDLGRKHFQDMGAVEEKVLAYVRPPKEDELVKGLPSTEAIHDKQEKARHKYGISKESNPIYS